MAATTTLSPAQKWVAELLAARARVECYERGAMQAYVDVIEARPVYTGPLARGRARVDERDGRPVVVLEGEITAEQAVPLLMWIERVMGLEAEP